ncbi:MAG: mechanosensitive ion channel [Gammaproteobacteria bacterium]|nr:mechanosensitive ion channel [Gammaproteobacteria bacterium]
MGDLLRLVDNEGIGEFIGVRITRLRIITGEQIIIANADLLKNRLHNPGAHARASNAVPIRNRL